MHEEQKLKCEGKMSFDTKREAETTAIVAGHQHGSKLSVYRCINCSLWHLSSKFGENE